MLVSFLAGEKLGLGNPERRLMYRGPRCCRLMEMVSMTLCVILGSNLSCSNPVRFLFEWFDAFEGFEFPVRGD